MTDEKHMSSPCVFGTTLTVFTPCSQNMCLHNRTLVKTNSKPVFYLQRRARTLFLRVEPGVGYVGSSGGWGGGLVEWGAEEGGRKRRRDREGC